MGLKSFSIIRPDQIIVLFPDNVFSCQVTNRFVAKEMNTIFVLCPEQKRYGIEGFKILESHGKRSCRAGETR